MPWSWSNIDWNGTGAMVQAIGSVAAIAAAIWIDQGTFRRQLMLRNRDRAEALADRRRAVAKAGEVLGMVATQMENTPITSSQYFILSETLQRSLDASKELVEFYLRQGGDSEAHLVLTLAHTSRILDRVREIYPRNKEVRPSEQGRMVELIRKQEQAIEQLLAEYDDKIW